MMTADPQKTNDERGRLYNFEAVRREGYKIAGKWERIVKGQPTYNEFIWAVSDIFGDYQLQKADENSWRNLNLEYVELFRRNGINITDSDTVNKLLVEDSEFKRKFRGDFLLAWNYWLLNRIDPVLRAVITAYTREHPLKFHFFAPPFWTRWAGGSGISEGGEIGVILGNKGSGKTDFALTLADVFMKDGWKFASNVSIKDLEYDYVTSFSQLLKTLAMNAYLKKKTFVVIDELAVAGMRRQRTMSGKSLNMEDLFRITRKLDTTMVLIWHYDKDITTELNETMSFIVRKQGGVNSPAGRRKAEIIFKIGDTSEFFVIDDIPKTDFDYQTNDLAPFSTDIKLSEIVDNIVRMEHEDPERNIYKDIIDYIEELQKERQQEENKQPDAKQDTEKEEKKRKAIEMRSNGLTITEIAKEIKMSVGWVWKYTSEPLNTS